MSLIHHETFQMLLPMTTHSQVPCSSLISSSSSIGSAMLRTCTRMPSYFDMISVPTLRPMILPTGHCWLPESTSLPTRSSPSLDKQITSSTLGPMPHRCFRKHPLEFHVFSNQTMSRHSALEAPYRSRPNLWRSIEQELF